jgi:FkbM family methyltransferase
VQGSTNCAAEFSLWSSATDPAVLDQLLIRYLRLPEHPAKYRIVLWLGRWAFPPEGVVAGVPPGVRLHLHPRDWIEYLLLRGKAYEPATLDFISRNLHPGDNALLAGVNNGLHVIVAAKAVGINGCVIGVEPQPAALLRARRNVALNEVAGTVHLVEAALGSTPGLAHMAWSSPENAGAASLFGAGPGLTVPLIRLSDVLDAACTGPVRLMLLDVQGYEVQALQGLSAARLPELLLVEDSSEFQAKSGTTRKTLYDHIIAMGYSVRDLFGGPVFSSGPEPHESNLVAVRADTTVTWLGQPSMSDR